MYNKILIPLKKIFFDINIHKKSIVIKNYWIIDVNQFISLIKYS